MCSQARDLGRQGFCRPLSGRKLPTYMYCTRPEPSCHPHAAIHPRYFCRRPASAGVAVGRLRRRRQGAGRAAPAGRHGRPAGQAHHYRSGRVCRPVRGGRGGRSARARLRLSRQDLFRGRADRQGRRPALHDRQAAVPERARPGERQSGDFEIERCLHASRSGARAATGARPHHHRAGLRSARPGLPQRAGRGHGERGAGAPGRARPDVHRTSGADHRPNRRPPGDGWQSGDGWHWRQHDDARHHRVDRPDPLRVHLRRSLAAALRAPCAQRQGCHRPHCAQPGAVEAHRRAGLLPYRPDGLHRQRGRAWDRHDPRPSAIRQLRRPVHARHVRAAAACGVGALRGADGSRCRSRHRTGAQIRAGGRLRRCRAAEIRDARRRCRRIAHHQERHRADRPGRRQRPDAGAAGQQGHAEGSERALAGYRPAGELRSIGRPRCVCPISSSTGRSSPRWCRS